MKVLQINTVYKRGSTGKIVYQLEEECMKKGHLCSVSYRYNEKADVYHDNCIQISSWLDCHIHNRISTLTWLQGCFSSIKTILFLKKVDMLNPDVIHIHNLHGSYINYRLLFDFLKKRSVSVVWTLHDCWAFTGYCPYFSYEKCEKWKSGCVSCPLYKISKNTIFDISAFMWKKKKKIFTGLDKLIIVTPSKWLADLVKQSFLKEYPIEIINNGIDLSTFKPVKSKFRERYNLEDKKIVLGVSFGWERRKGIDIFLELSTRLPEEYQIVLVGTNEQVDKILPSNIISIHRTENQNELAEIYTAADVFVNPTRDEVFGLVNVEANACGTPVITFDAGGSPECIDEGSGIVVPCDDIKTLEKEIIYICTSDKYNRESCINRAQEFDMKDKMEEYINLYERVRLS